MWKKCNAVKHCIPACSIWDIPQLQKSVFIVFGGKRLWERIQDLVVRSIKTLGACLCGRFCHNVQAHLANLHIVVLTFSSDATAKVTLFTGAFFFPLSYSGLGVFSHLDWPGCEDVTPHYVWLSEHSEKL